MSKTVVTFPDNVVDLRGYFRNKKQYRALKRMCLAYDAQLSAEQDITRALIQLEEAGIISPEDEYFCEAIEEHAEYLKRGSKLLKALMHNIALLMSPELQESGSD